MSFVLFGILVGAYFYYAGSALYSFLSAGFVVYLLLSSGPLIISILISFMLIQVMFYSKPQLLQ